MKRVGLLLLGLVASVPAWAADLTVSAASSLTESFRELGAAYENTHPGTKVDFNFAASGVLLQQISRGAPVDVFASADETTMDQAQQQNLLATGTRVIFAVNALWVVVPPQAKAPPRMLQDLAGNGVRRIALGNPDSVPVGRYAKGALEAAGLWPLVQGRIITTQNVRQSLDYVARGEVDAGFVYATDAQAMPNRVRRAFAVPVSGRIAYPLAVTSASTQPAEARRFAAFVGSVQGQAILARHGFGKP
ncbi:molybdate ABC transporter substrate-binding protein [Stenotrophomonas maltophilia]|uniref:molybdate ABC transporter substrate-binding protein n=1 Tax=Stenotrophomonas maltophilia TaxID=40324 RepID=UPI001F44A600|nr:molybdate ABC transporter substrate-binding protein [Stenotrophomonas maltophilia]MCF3551523.1 molybdate ABC transporter substrate-binding protein [Stenotrophomonas maltophilia]MCF3559655.1 molybdate ABC transporter substrate-binding protein [Stenotrophomonas maltophilia]MCF3564249.1 molybdate ABC transporter substrate-binding protein [Stenotrophomonas maltophilia]